MNEIAEFFSGNRNFGKNVVDDQYAKWFRDVTETINGIDYKNSTKTGRRI